MYSDIALLPADSQAMHNYICQRGKYHDRERSAYTNAADRKRGMPVSGRFQGKGQQASYIYEKKGGDAY